MNEQMNKIKHRACYWEEMLGLKNVVQGGWQRQLQSVIPHLVRVRRQNLKVNLPQY